MNLLLQLLVNGIVIGAIYALASIGYALTFSLNINNFAHGSVMMMGSFVGYCVLRNAGLPLWLTVPIVIAAGLILGQIIYMAAVKPMQKLSSWAVILASTLALAVILENFVLMVHGYELFSIRDFIGTPKIFKVSSVAFTNIQLGLIAASIFILVLLLVVLKKSDIGIKFQAVADDPEAAEAMGISTNKILMLSLMIAGALAAIAGFLISFDYDQDATVGTAMLMKSYTATIIGGVNNLKRVVAAAYFLGILENLVAGYISTEYMLASVFLVLILFLMFRKEGFGALGLKREI
jgi:branched-chain amino acid transport system permease protein